MKIVLHIGSEKTGTTSIQNFLSHSPKKLSEHKALYYAGHLLGTTASTELVLASVEKPGLLVNTPLPDFETFRSQVQQEIHALIQHAENNGMEYLLFSSEHMASRIRTCDGLKLLRQLFPKNCAFEIYFYCRRQDQLYLSTVAESIKAGASFTTVGAEKIKLGSGYYSTEYYDYNALLAPWAEVFGQQSIRLRIFESSQLVGGDVIADFLFNCLGIEDLSSWKTTDRKYRNRRFSAEILYFLSEYNHHCTPEQRKQFLQMARELDVYPSNSLVATKALRRFLHDFADSNQQVAKTYLNKNRLFEKQEIMPDEYRFQDRARQQLAQKEISAEINYRKTGGTNNQAVNEWRRQLLAVHDLNLVCSRRTTVCIEGYPRSANTFIISFLNLCCRRASLDYSFAHHTHSILNLKIATALQIPSLVLIRQPLDAITSLVVHNRQPAEKMVEFYMKFYRGVLELEAPCLMVGFEQVTGDINTLFKRLNHAYNLNIPLSVDLDRDAKFVRQIALKRAAARHQNNPEEAIRTVGVPNLSREALKAEVRPLVKRALENNPQVEQLYAKICQLPGYF